MGRAGTGTLNIEAGGAVSNTGGYIGRNAGSVGAVTVTGAGSTWANTSDLFSGVSGAAELTVSEGGAVWLFIAQDAGSFGTLNIGAAAADAAVAAGSLDATAVVFGAGTGKLVFNHTDTAFDFDIGITGAGAVDVLSGTTTLSVAAITRAIPP